MIKPPCADWKLWTGAEIEGTADLGVKTLFIRSLEDFKIGDEDLFAEALSEMSGCSRVWFCKEFKNWSLLQKIAKHFKAVCVEVEPQCIRNLPLAIRKSYRLYVKLVIDEQLFNTLKSGDFICVGPAFADEAFELGTGTKVNPQLYLNDRKIK